MPDVSLSKVANCFIANAATSQSLPGPVRGAVDNYRKRHGGVWVGGRIHVRDGRMWFSANAMNRAAHSNLQDQEVNLGDVVSVEVRPGVLTRIVDVSTNNELLRFRCFGAESAAETVRRAVQQARGTSPA